MSKPLLTDDVIEQAKRGEIDLEDHPYYQDYEEEFYDEDYEANYQPSAYKSRRIEQWLLLPFPRLRLLESAL